MPEQTTSSERPSKIRVGTGVPRKAEEEKPATASAEEYKEQLDDSGHSKWSDKPSIGGQFIRHPKTCRKMPPQVKVFNLSNPEHLVEFNVLLDETHPPENPKVVMVTQEQFHEGSWCVLARFQRIQYKILISLK